MRIVTPNGSNTADGISQPCNLWRAVQLANQGVPDRNFQLTPGIYTHSQLTLSGNDAVFNCAGAELTSYHQSLVTSSWERHSEYTWRTLLHNPIIIGTVVQRGNWKPILVDDHNANGVPYNRPFTLVEPIKLKWVESILEVNAQYGTWHYSAGYLYVHLYHSGQPTDADDIWISPQNWGSFIITGRNNLIDGLTIRNTSNVGLQVTPKGIDNHLNNICAIDAQIHVEGYRTIVNKLDVSHVIKQGDSTHEECWSGNGSVGECWNAHGEGYGLLIGRERAAHVYNQYLSSVFVHRCWNGISINGPNELTQSYFWGFANHALVASGNSVKVNRCIFMNSQDSFFARGAFNGWELKKNYFHGAVYITASDNGTGGALVAGWEFKDNIYNSLVVDHWVHWSMSSDRNRRIDNNGNGYRVIDTNELQGFTEWEIPNR